MIWYFKSIVSEEKMFKKILISLILLVSFIQAASIQSHQVNYTEGQPMTFTVSEMAGNTNDWIGIYPQGSNNDWSNVVAWKWTQGKINGDIRFSSIPAGNYEVRAFFNNSYKVEATDTFSVQAAVYDTTITTAQDIFDAKQPITVSLAHMSGDSKDWVGIYPVGSSNSWNNVVAWAWTGGIINGDITLDGVPAGNYEARAFFYNSYKVEATDTFSVKTADHKVKIFIIGDSTVHNDSTGEMGWGSKLADYVTNDTATIFNQARSGSSSKSYKVASSSHHDWDTTKQLMQQEDLSQGAYLFIQFGHNDEKQETALHTEPGKNNSYYNELKVYIDQARALGVTPVLITSVERMYKGLRSHGQYPQTVRDLADDEGVLLLDLEEKSFQEFNTFESTQAILDEFHYDDHTHFRPHGASIVAGWIQTLICNSSNQNLCTLF